MARKDQDPFATDPWADGDDPFQEMLAKQAKRRWGSSRVVGPDAGAPSASSAPSLPQPPSGVAPPRRTGAGAAIGIVAVVLVLSVGATALVGLWSSTQSGDQGVDADWSPPPTVLAQADAIGAAPAAPGTVIRSGNASLEVGVDVAPGVYVAEGALPGACWWTLEGQLEGVGTSTFLYGETTGTDPLVVLGEGFVFATYDCPDWVAVDPATAFEGATASSFAGTASLVGGRDIVPGRYLTTGAADPTQCFARTVDAYAALGGSYGDYAVTTVGGTTVIDVRAGDQVFVTGCEDFEAVDLDEALALGRGAESFGGEGEYLVGIDVQPGTYATRGAADSCTITVYPDYHFWYTLGADTVTYYGTEGLSDVTLEAGQGISVWECPEFERTS